MPTMSVCCGSTNFRCVSHAIKSMFWALRRPSGKKQFCDGVVQTYLYLLRTTKRSGNFTFASVEKIVAEFGVDGSTAKRWLRILRENGFITRGRKFLWGEWKRGFYINAHELVVNTLKTIKGIVVRVFQDGEEDAEHSIRQAVEAAERARRDAREPVAKGQVVGNLHPQLTIRNRVSGKESPLPPRKRGERWR